MANQENMDEPSQKVYEVTTSKQPQNKQYYEMVQSICSNLYRTEQSDYQMATA